MRIKFLTSLAAEHESYRPGQVVEVDRRRGKDLIRAGAAIETTEPVGGWAAPAPSCCSYCGATTGLSIHGATGAWHCATCRRFVAA